ncbi:MAG: hypothetical protein P8Y29_10475 [Gemmatimonadota bacterium]|jgi:hypothetical protein
MRVLYSVLSIAASAFSLAALLAMTVPEPSPEGALIAELGPITVIAVETPPVLASSDDSAEMKTGRC